MKNYLVIYCSTKKIECITILWWVLVLLFVHFTSRLTNTFNCIIYHAFTQMIIGCKQDNTSHTHLLFYWFCNCFLRNISRIFLKKFSKKSLIKKKKSSCSLLRFMLKIWQKMSFSKKLKFIYKSFYCLKASITMLNECFC
jgi:hypothetical protein